MKANTNLVRKNFQAKPAHRRPARVASAIAGERPELFRLDANCAFPIPIQPIDADGSARVADGVHFLDLAQAAHASGLAADLLSRHWCGAMKGIVDDVELITPPAMPARPMSALEFANQISTRAAAILRDLDALRAALTLQGESR